MAFPPLIAAISTLLGLLSPIHGDLDKQIAAVTTRLQTVPATAELYVQRAELHRLHEDWDACAADLALAQALDSEHVGWLLTTARLEQDRKQPGVARKHVLQLLAKESLAPALRLEVELLHAEVLTALRETEAAIVAWTTLLQQHPSPSPDWFLQRAALQDPAQALAGIEEAMEQIGQAIALVLRASELEEALGHTEAACARLQPLVDASPRKETWLARQADILARGQHDAAALGKYQEARRHLQKLPPRHRDTFSMRKLAAHLDQAIANLTS